MRVFLYEDITGGGCEDVPQGSLLREGAAMLAALAADLIAYLSTCSRSDPQRQDDSANQLVVLHDQRLKRASIDDSSEDGAWLQIRRVNAQTWQESFVHEAAAADWTLLIAPEIGNRLSHLCRLVGDAGGQLLGPPLAIVELFSDKCATAKWLNQQGVPTPPTESPPSPQGTCEYPIVVKPRFGAGSHELCYIASRDDWSAWSRGRDLASYCAQPFAAGETLSVAVICGPSQRVVLPATRQLLSQDGRFQYRGGQTLPAADPRSKRARDLAMAIVSALPDSQGYLGIDLVLGSTPADDQVIEINPRLTTSYVGLREVIDNNLGRCMLDVASGRPVSLARLHNQVEFLADGQIVRGGKCTLSPQ